MALAVAGSRAISGEMLLPNRGSTGHILTHSFLQHMLALHTFPSKHPEEMKLSNPRQVVFWLVRIRKSKGLVPLEVNDVGRI